MLNGLRWCGQLFRRRATLIKNKLPHCLAHVVMHLIRCCLADWSAPAQLLFRLGGAEEVGSQFCAAHVVENLLPLLQPLACGNHGGRLTRIEATIAVILKRRKAIARDACSKSGGGELLIAVSYTHLRAH